MKVVAHRQAIPDELRNGSVALGNFDGVHLGHQAVIGAARAEAKGRPVVVATFDPHPLRVLRPETPPFMLSTVAQKCEYIEALGADGVVVIPFDKALAGRSARAFAEDWLSAQIGARHVVTGRNFLFGHNREGDVETLAALGREFGFTTHALEAVDDAAGVPISSTRIRAFLKSGHPDEAARFLTRPFSIRGPVVHGNEIGRTIDVPTANLRLDGYLRPRYGVYGVKVRLPDGSVKPGVANIGIRPMFTPPVELLEVWILDWSGNLYEKEIDVALIGYLRPELKLDGLAALKTQIAEDEARTRALLS